MGIWSRLGKADFAQCAAIISRFDPTLRNSLKLSPGRVLQKALQYMWRKSERLGADVWWCDFSQMDVAAKIGRSRSTVIRALDRLEEMGLLERTFRRPKPGMHYQTCLYRPGPLLKAVLARIAGQVREIAPCSKSAPQVFRKKTTKAGASPTDAPPATNQLPPEDTWTKEQGISFFATLKEQIRTGFRPRSPA